MFFFQSAKLLFKILPSSIWFTKGGKQIYFWPSLPDHKPGLIQIHHPLSTNSSIKSHAANIVDATRHQFKQHFLTTIKPSLLFFSYNSHSNFFSSFPNPLKKRKPLFTPLFIHRLHPSAYRQKIKQHTTNILNATHHQFKTSTSKPPATPLLLLSFSFFFFF